MEKKLSVWLGGVLLFGAIGCQKDIDLELAFALTYDGEPLVMEEEYLYPDGRKLRFTRVSFYLSDLEVVGDGDAVILSDVEFVNLTTSHGNLENSKIGQRLISTKVDLPRIEQVNFNIGLTEEQNIGVPGDFPTTHPLSKPGEYWLAWDSFIFAKIEGWVDNDGDGETETGIALHLGSNQVMRQVSLQVDSQESLTILLDMMNVFGQQEIYDIDANPKLHSLAQMPVAEQLADNLSRAFRIKK